MEYRFEWDPNKAQQNRKKHGTSFEQAATVFADPRAVTLYDTEHSEHEERWITLGLSVHAGLLVVCHTFEWIDPTRAHIRIISCRRATRQESRQYSE